MATPKPARLVQQLLEKSNEGKIKWEKTATDGVFQAAFPGYSIRLSTEPSAFSSQEDYFVQISNDEGETVEIISDSNLTSMIGSDAWRMMKDLYQGARRSAMGVDAALDSILAELEEGEDTPF